MMQNTFNHKPPLPSISEYGTSNGVEVLIKRVMHSLTLPDGAGGQYYKTVFAYSTYQHQIKCGHSLMDHLKLAIVFRV